MDIDVTVYLPGARWARDESQGTLKNSLDFKHLSAVQLGKVGSRKAERGDMFGVSGREGGSEWEE